MDRAALLCERKETLKTHVFKVSDCRQTYAAKHRHAWGDCEGGTGIPSSRSIHAKMGTFSEVPILAFEAVDTLSTASKTLKTQFSRSLFSVLRSACCVLRFLIERRDSYVHRHISLSSTPGSLESVPSQGLPVERGRNTHLPPLCKGRLRSADHGSASQAVDKVSTA